MNRLCWELQKGVTGPRAARAALATGRARDGARSLEARACAPTAGHAHVPVASVTAPTVTAPEPAIVGSNVCGSAADDIVKVFDARCV